MDAGGCSKREIPAHWQPSGMRIMPSKMCVCLHVSVWGCIIRHQNLIRFLPNGPSPSQWLLLLTRRNPRTHPTKDSHEIDTK